MPPEILTTLALTSLLAIAGQPARLASLPLGNLIFGLNLTHQNAASHQQHLNALGVANTGRTVRAICMGPRPQLRAPATPFRFVRSLPVIVR